MNWLDIVLALVLAGSTLAGIFTGFARTVIGIVAAVLAVIMATWFYGTAGSVFTEYVSSKSVSNFLGFVMVFLLVLVAGALIGRLMAMLFKWVGLSWLDRTLGACFGLVRGLLVATVIVMILMAFSLTQPPKAVASSTLAPYVMDAARLFSKAAPRELTDGFAASYEKIRKLWNATLQQTASSH
jgi:membrane protein required for colicin V production